MTMTERQPRMIPNPLYCERCDKYGYRVIDAEWEPYAVQCPSGFSPLECDGRRPRPAHRRAAGIPRLFVLTPRALCPSPGLLARPGAFSRPTMSVMASSHHPLTTNSFRAGTVQCWPPTGTVRALHRVGLPLGVDHPVAVPITTLAVERVRNHAWLALSHRHPVTSCYLLPAVTPIGNRALPWAGQKKAPRGRPGGDGDRLSFRLTSRAAPVSPAAVAPRPSRTPSPFHTNDAPTIYRERPRGRRFSPA
jgi:hypothetical protein